jgi:hypothetical protein
MQFPVTEKRILYRGLVREVNFAPGTAMLAAYRNNRKPCENEMPRSAQHRMAKNSLFRY